MRVSDVLTSKGSTTVFTIEPSATVSDLLDALAEHDVGALVVSPDGRRLDERGAHHIDLPAIADGHHRCEKGA